MFDDGENSLARRHLKLKESNAFRVSLSMAESSLFVAR